MMNCINCGKPHNNKFTLVMGMKLCDACNRTSDELSDLLKQGIELEIYNPDTKKTIIETLRS